MDSGGDLIATLDLSPLKVVIALQIEPEFRAGAEIASKAQAGVAGHRAALGRQVLNAADRNVDILG